MDQLKNYADSRLLAGCIYCGGLDETRDHAPSKVFLDLPFPENLPVVPACWNCNNGFSLDEEYVACLLDAMIVGSVDPTKIQRESIRRILKRNPLLSSMIDAGISTINDQTIFTVMPERIQNIVLKLARGHAAFELGEPFRDPPSFIRCAPLRDMSEQVRKEFEDVEIPMLLGEVGSRSIQRLQIMELTLQSPSGERIIQSHIINDWIDVQENRYRYIATTESNGARIRIVIGNFFACDVRWND